MGGESWDRIRPPNIFGVGLTYDLTLARIEPIPEPASLLLFGTGLVGLRAWRKRLQ